jgi:hypothetical protein
VRRQAGLRLPRAVCVANTVAVLHLLAQALFFPDIVEAGLPRRLLHQLLPGGICQAPAA